MPLFDYRCAACDTTFEALVRPSTTEVPCPSCDSGDTERAKLQLFAVGRTGSASAAPLPGPCGSCPDPRGPGCALN